MAGEFHGPVIIFNARLAEILLERLEVRESGPTNARVQTLGQHEKNQPQSPSHCAMVVVGACIIERHGLIKDSQAILLVSCPTFDDRDSQSIKCI